MSRKCGQDIALVAELVFVDSVEFGELGNETYVKAPAVDRSSFIDSLRSWGCTTNHSAALFWCQ